MDWLGSMSRGKGKKGRDGESQALKRLHWKLKPMEGGSYEYYES